MDFIISQCSFMKVAQRNITLDNSNVLGGILTFTNSKCLVFQLQNLIFLTKKSRCTFYYCKTVITDMSKI